MDTRPSRDIDARARDRAAKRYRQVGDDWVKVKKVKGAWVLDATSKKFASLDEAVVHEMALTQQRRTTWRNLIKGRVNKHITSETDRVVAVVSANSQP